MNILPVRKKICTDSPGSHYVTGIQVNNFFKTYCKNINRRRFLFRYVSNINKGWKKKTKITFHN